VANQGVNTAEPKPGMLAIILGAGAIGLGVLCNLKANGVEDILVSDVVPNRLQAVEQLGGIPVNAKDANVFDVALERFGSITDIYGVERADVDLYFDAAGGPGDCTEFATGAKRGAKLVALALSGNTVILDPEAPPAA